MWPASTSTTMPSGSLRPSLTIVFKSEPSGLHESTRPSLRSKTNRRPKVAFVVPFKDFDFAALEDIEFTCSFSEIDFANATAQRERSKRFTFRNALNERAQTGDGFADNQVLHLKRAFVGVERFGICEEARNVVVCGYAVSSQQLSGPGHRLAALGGAERFRKRSMRVCHFSFGLQLSQANQQTLRGSDIGKHPGEKVLDELKRADRLSKLQTLLGVLESILVRAHGASRRFPADEVASPAQDFGRVAEGFIFLETVLLRDPAILHSDQAVLNHLKCNLVLNFFDLEARRGLVLHDETLDLIVGKVARPDDRDVAPRGVTDPFFLPVDNPGVALAFGGRQQAASCSRTHQRLGQTEAADLFHASHRRKPLLFLLFRSTVVDGRHCQAAVHTEERGNRRVDSSHLHRHQTG